MKKISEAKKKRNEVIKEFEKENIKCKYISFGPIEIVYMHDLSGENFIDQYKYVIFADITNPFKRKETLLERKYGTAQFS